MSRIRIIVLATGLLITLVSWNSDLQAQTSAGLGGPLGSSLLSKPAVQQELQLTKEQKSKLQKVTAVWNQQRRERLDTIRKSLSEGAADPEAIRTQILAMREEGETPVAKILARSQRIRLEQIALQQEGLSALTRPEIAQRLNMSPEQQELIREIIVQMRQGMLQQAQGDLSRMLGEPSVNGRVDREATQAEALSPELKSQMSVMQKKAGDRIRQQAARGRQRASQEIGKILSRKQREAYNRMLGKPFDPTKPGGGGDRRAASDTRSTDQPKAESPSSTGQALRKKSR
jgi:hypothetical protein